MSAQVEKSGTGIHRSGTGIRKGGTGIHRSGTGIKKGGTGSKFPSFIVTLSLAAIMLCGSAFAAEPEILVSERGDHLLVSLHSDAGIFIGAAPLSAGDAGYFQVGLHQATAANEQGMVVSPLVKSSGSGNSGESVDLSNGSLLVKSSGSGNSGESVCSGSGLLVKSSGSGASGESVDMPGGSLMVKSSGSGNSGEAADGCNVSFDLLAELVIDRSGSHIVVHDLSGNELLVAYVAATSSGTPVGDQPNTVREFVAAP